ncbi:SusC/RagA family TonB-linked outer membrane protein [Flavobacterium psychrotolerans]|uniref:SusC/RagA family TonB-linked outer membrane protein n=1 Tax=Flavobacterium psychrotolerans TaxID=2169410 RepID=A0A2U1JIU5_9FLAO|nr:SusC/RagA family TonB-linked outer membrane protein [Flavobacterium psychrotolerans]PWA04935.1 SusC/RagA family TonB-linked outer membrane protein [Flavobacterium psychrotolerans]
MKLKFNGFLVLLLVLLTQITFAQDRTVAGVVTDESGLPIPGVNVLVKGTNNGIQTDFDGKFKIAASQGQKLVFSFLGMKTQEVTASSTSLKVKMQDDSVQLEGVVVTALGIKRQKKSLGYATATVTAKDLTEVNNTNLFGSLSGKLAGVDISAPAQVGASTKVVIRGFSSLGNNDPLYVIDGTPINNTGNGTSGVTTNRRTFDAGNGIGDLDPSNIESMTILKGAAATALYGSRAASGAIIVTTKSGKINSKLTVDISSSMDFSEVARVPHLQDKFGQGWYGQGFSSLPSHGASVSAENGSWGPAFNGEIRPWGAIVNNSQQIKPYVALKNNVKDFYDIGNSYTNNFRISGGGENSNFSLGFSDVNSDGIVPTDSDSYKRRNFNVSAGINSSKLDVRVNVNYVKKDQKAVNTGSGDDSGEGQTLVQELLQIPVDISIVDLKDYVNNPFNNPSNYFTPYASNPYFVLNENATKIDGNRLFGNTNITYKFNPKFSATYQIGGDYRMEKIKSYGAIVKYTEGSSQDVNNTVATVGGVTEQFSERAELDSYFNLNYNTKINDDFNISAMVGASANERKSDALTARITELDLPNYYELSNSASKPILTQGNSLRRNFGVYTSLETSYKDKLFLTLTGRNDWSSALPVKNNSYFYPSASLSGIVLDTPDTFLKLRAGWAQVSKDTEAYRTESSLTQAVAGANFGTINFPIGGVNAYEFKGQLGNNELKPETTSEVEFGAEANLFSRRVNIDASIYNKKTVDLLYDRAIPASTGFTTQTGNILDVTNKGIELVLNIIPIQTKSFTWNFNTTFTKNLSNVDNIVGGVDKLELTNGRDVTFNAVLGQPLGVYMAKVPKLSPAGQYIVDANGYYVPTEENQKIGTSERDFVMGFQNKFTYKNFMLSFGIDWKQGGEMFSESKYLAYFTGNGIETTYNDRNTFIIPNSVTEVVNGGVTTYVENTNPINAFTGTSNQTDFYNSQKNPTISKDFIFDKTFVRLRDISITFNVPSTLVKRIGLTNASFSVYGKNLALWTPNANPYVDPEISTFGNNIQGEFGESYGTPSQRTYGTTIKLTF